MPPTPYSSGNPVIDQLFGREFTNYQTDLSADIARDQIRAQRELAQAQYRGSVAQQDYNNLFRMQELRSREKAQAEQNALFKRQLDISEKAKVDEIKAREQADSDARTQQRKAAIALANATADSDAQRANALYQINFEKALADAKSKVKWIAPGLLGGDTVAELDDLKSPKRRAIQKQVFDTVRSQLLAEKGGALSSLIPDPETFIFNPVRLDSEGNVVSGPFKSGTPNEYDYMGNPLVPAVPAPTPAPGASTTPSPAGSLGTLPTPYPAIPPAVTAPTAVPPGTTGLDYYLRQKAQEQSQPANRRMTLEEVTPEEKAGYIIEAGRPIVDRVLSSAADMFGIKAPTLSPPLAPQMIQIPLAGQPGQALEMSVLDAAEAERQLRAVPPENQAATAAAIRDQLMKSGRARIVILTTP